ncbi:MAG: dihydrofolate reductase family protein [Bacteroidota bacterium]
MRRVTLYIAQSLDGIIADADGGVDWLPHPPEGEDLGYGAFWQTVDALAMGRATYDQIRGWGAWPYESRPTVVFSSRPPDDDPPAGVRFASGDVAAALDTLPPEAHVWCVGGAELAARFLAAGALDAVHLFIVPVLLGGGVRLWREGLPRTALRLDWTREHAGGVEMRYAVIRAPEASGG